MVLCHSDHGREPDDTGRPPDLRDYAFDCPVCRASADARGRTCKIVRSRMHGVTMECRRCGLSFTMKRRQLTKAARRLAREDRGGWSTPEPDTRRATRSEFDVQ